ncbi:hypothetical protein KC19_11G019900 [Ceratodon purpureus]|uniref:ABC1 atypical kinase-like domain-containing protein n=1 Tax=Ceratodon purpureus TaxID=3225 RepID=A0A8T0GFQ9_CERPU|nr:hypothetical protein KC19_11G019900 [Ceratodon purpureus]
MNRVRGRLAPLLGSTLRSAGAGGVVKGIHQVARAGEAQELGRDLGRGFATAGALVQETPKQRGWVRRVGTVALGTGVAGAAAWVATGDYPLRRITMLYTIPVRLARDVTTAVAMVADYKYSLYGLAEGSAEREEAQHEAHMRCANRLQALCFKNGGIYIKLGQHIGQLDYLLPEEYVKTMRASMLDKCPVSTYKQVCDVFLAQLGRLPNEVFEEFDQVPLASASLAQVHTAKTFDGQKIAVKELDFLNEGRNCEKAMENFKKLSPKLASQISVPHIYWEYSTQRILAMEYMDGVGVTDVGAIKALGLQPADVARLVSQTFSEMIFRHGFVHCDPHAANMMVRAKPGPCVR